LCLFSTGTVFIIPVIGGFIADTIAGKYNTILGAGLIYLLGKVIQYKAPTEC
jgi:dipeptide/tripeptide permease